MSYKEGFQYRIGSFMADVAIATTVLFAKKFIGAFLEKKAQTTNLNVDGASNKPNDKNNNSVVDKNNIFEDLLKEFEKSVTNDIKNDEKEGE